MEKKHREKMIAPTVVAIIVAAYFLGYVALFLWEPNFSLLAKIIGAIVGLALAGVCVFVWTERIKEIRSGEEDDLSQY